MESTSESPVAGALLGSNSMKTFSASSGHCVCIRNGRMYSWGDNRLGRLGKELELNYSRRGLKLKHCTFTGVRVNRDKLPGPIEIPIPVNLSPCLKLVIESVSCGQTHTVALTDAGVSFH